MEENPIKIDEIVEIDMTEAGNSGENADFAAVVFHNIPEYFPVDAHVECSYTVTSDIVPTTRDWVGLYRVGWMTPGDYIYYEWAPLPKDYQVGKSAESRVLFQAHNLPEDDGDFYQFCYVASSSQIRGASTPFQFRKPSSHDFVELEDPDTDMLVIRSKTAYLQENLTKAEEERTKLMETKISLQVERDDIAAKYAEIKKKLSHTEQNSDLLKSRVKSNETQIGQLHREAQDMMVVHDELHSSLDTLKQEKAKLDLQIVKLTKEIDSVNAELKKVQTEKDQLSGEKHALEEQVNLYKEHFTSSESSATQFSMQVEQQQIVLAEKDSLINHLQKAVNELKQTAETNKDSLDKQVSLQVMKQEQVDTLSEQLKNAEDKLHAAEELKLILQTEISSYQESQAELTDQIQRSKSECHSLKQKLALLEEDFQVKIKVQESEREQATADLLASTHEKNKLQMENSQLQDQVNMSLEQTDMRTGSLTCMKQALTRLKERLAKKDKQCHSLEKAIMKRETEFQEREHDLKREIEDLKERIFMCSEEYKTIMNKNSKLQKRYEKVSGKNSRSRQNSTTSLVETERLQSSAAGEGQDDELSIDGRQVRDLETGLAAVDAEIQQQKEKKEKYKTLYVEERQRSEDIRGKHLEELRIKEDEIILLKQKIAEVPCQLEVKVHAMEKLVTEKEQTIQELTRMLQETNLNRDERKSRSSTPKEVPDTDSPYTDGLMYGNPYLTKQAQYGYPRPAPYVIYPGTAHINYPVTPQSVMQMPRTPCAPPPLSYPPHSQKPVTKQPERRSSSSSSTSPLDSEVENKEEITLSEPLTPLPAPLQPERTARQYDLNLAEEMDDFAPGLNMLVNQDMSPYCSPLVFGDNKEERFLDAPGDPMRMCRHCNQNFSADMTEEMLDEHELTHVHGICPVCNMMKSEDMTDIDFEKHVNKHLDEDEDELA